jgi:AcrR family transcriptional regulator
MSVTDVNYDQAMGRWEPDAAGRLQKAALDLFEERGFEQTTVAAISERAGVTERTFFRHYADKREVLFGLTEPLRSRIADTAAAAPPEATPLDVVAARRNAVITATPELRERDLVKMAALAGVLADALRARGVPDLEARLAADTGIAVFKIAFERWLTGPGPDDLPACIRDVLAANRALTAGR